MRLLDKEALESLKKERESTSDNIGNDVQQLGPSVQRMRSNGCTDGKERITKLEFIGDDIYQIMVKYLEIDGKPYVMELLKCMDKNSLIAQGGRERLILQSYRI